MIKRVVLAACLALPLTAGLLPHAHAATTDGVPKVPTSVNASGPMFCVWSNQLNLSYCQYTFPRLP